jgi:hypothetical protein
VALAFAHRSVVVVKAMCWWCFGIWLSCALQVCFGIINHGSSEIQLAQTLKRTIGFSLPVLAAAAVLGVVHSRNSEQLTGVNTARLQRADIGSALQSGWPILAGPQPQGDLLVFMDYSCPSCRSFYPKLKQFSSVPGRPRVHLIFTSLWKDDLSSMYAASTLELASRNKAIVFMDDAFAGPLHVRSLRQSLERFELPSEVRDSVLSSLEGQPYQKLRASRGIVADLEIRRTPSFVLIDPDGSRRAVSPTEFRSWL